jgi:protein-S-isoprenylcysteine O-methyltransferase Ste14
MKSMTSMMKSLHRKHLLYKTMNSNSTWFEVFVYLGIGIAFLAIAAFLLSITNPRIEAKCAAKGGQVLVSPGQISSCLYPAK